MINVAELNSQARKLPFGMPEFTPLGGGPVPGEKALSAEAKAMLNAWKPLLEKVDFSNDLAGAPGYRKQFETSAKLVMAQMLTNVARTAPSQWQREATLAGTDIPSYARQNIATILRAFPKLFAIQLFGVVPFSGPDGRIFFRDAKYNTAFAGSVPNIADGDRLDDLAKFNKDFFKIGQGQQANKVKLSITSMTVGVDSYRVVGDWFYEGEDDFSTVYGGDLGNALIAEMSHMLAWVTDRTLVDAALANVPAENVVHWDAAPTGYDALAPSEKKAYDETIWGDGILKVITAIKVKRALSADPNWVIADPKAAEKLMKLTTFVPVGGDNTVDLNYGALRDIGTLRSVGLRVLVDPQMPAGTLLFGRKPVSDFDPAIMYCPYRPIRVTGTLEQPGIGQYERGVYSRFGVAVPNTGLNAASSQLADNYGKLVIDNIG